MTLNWPWGDGIWNISIRYLWLGSPETTTEIEGEFNRDTNTEEIKYVQPLNEVRLILL